MLSNLFRILLVEDNPGDARLVRLALSEAEDVNFKVQHVERLNQALAMLAANNFDAVLLDLSLPDSHGLDTVVQLKTSYPSVPIIVLSGLMDEAVAIDAVKNGAQDYLVKGQENGYLISRAIRYAIERKHSEEALRKVNDELERRVQERTAELIEVNQKLRAEIAERKRSEEAQRQSKHQLRLITDALPALISYIDSNERYLFANKSYKDWFAYSGSTIQGLSVKEVVGTSVYKKIHHHIKTALSGKKVTFEVEVPNQHNRLHYLNVVYVPDWNEPGEVTGVFTLLQDITEQKRAEEQEKRRLLQLAHVSRLSTMGEMATQIAHEINQPLTAIASYGDTCQRMLKAHRGQPQDLLDVLGKITNQAERAGEVIRQLRNFVRKNDSHRSTLDINDLVRESVRLIEVEARWHAVSIQLKLTKKIPSVLANPILVQQVLLNLVRNAIDALADVQQNMRQLSIETAVEDTKAVKIAVRDTGPGLPSGSVDQVFEPFYTTKTDGMGMGLSISESIIKAQGGKLWGNNNASGGCTFAFSLPIG